ncbi:hypothetical protein B1K96_35095, partial [Escherichia coli]
IRDSNQSIKRWNLRTRIEEPDFEWDNIVRLFARVNEAGVPNRGDISVSALDPTIEAEALDRFSARVQRLLLEKISPIEVTLDPLSN